MKHSSKHIEQEELFSKNIIGRQIDLHHHPELMRAVFQLRYDVYCRECKFLPACDYEEKLETDEYDNRAAHFCALDRQGSLMGYARLIGHGADGLFPFQKYVDSSNLSIDKPLPDPANCAEISRLMVCPNYRRGRSGTASSHHSSKVLLILYKQIYSYSKRTGIKYWYAAMERSLARSLRKFDFFFEQIGPQTDYYGPVAPYLADLRDLEMRSSRGHPNLWNWLNAEEYEDLKIANIQKSIS